jgi:hypothetical protein
MDTKKHRGIAMTTAAKNPRGRPRTHENTELITALIAKQDAMSERTAGEIAAILSRHISADAAEWLWRRISREARVRLGALPARAAARTPGLAHPDVVRFLETQIDAILTDARMAPDDGVRIRAHPPAAEQPPTVMRSRMLSQARGQLARLQTDLMDLKARIRPYQELGR